jgi:cellulose biosynthesis protein BcsQ
VLANELYLSYARIFLYFYIFERLFMRILSVVNNKGGVGKTTVATCLGQGLALIGKRVLLIDNDRQHHATIAVSGSQKHEYTRSVRDIYQMQDYSRINDLLTETVQTSAIEGLYYIPSTSMLSHLDVIDPDTWKNVFELSSMQHVFDVVIFDNPPGTDELQSATLTASDMAIVPTELKTRSTIGLFELYLWLTDTIGFTADRIKIIPNGYKQWSKYEGFLNVIKSKFSASITTAIPYDEVFDEMDATNKVIFFSRLRAKAVPFVIKVITEIFPEIGDSNSLENSLKNKRREYKSQQAKLQFSKYRTQQVDSTNHERTVAAHGN